MRRLRSFGAPVGGLCGVLNKEVPTVIALLHEQSSRPNRSGPRGSAWRLSLARRIHCPRLNWTLTYDPRAVRRGALEAHLSSQHPGSVPHDLQPHARGLLGMRRPSRPVVSDRHANLRAGGIRMRAYDPGSAVPHGVAHGLLSDPLQVIGELGAERPRGALPLSTHDLHTIKLGGGQREPLEFVLQPASF